MMKRLVTVAAAAIGLCFLGQAASAEVASKGAPANPNSTFTLIKYGGHGGHGGYGGMRMGHMGHHMGPGFRFSGPRHFNSFAFRGRHHHFRGRRGFFFYGGPFFYDDYYGGSCYWNCRQFHGPRYCSYYSYNYCY